jgi:hypothetical protein
MNWSARVSCTMWSAALLAPLPAAAESQIHAAATRMTASAHVNFKIVIPTVLSMEVLSRVHSGDDVQKVAIGSNGRTVMLAATVQGSNLPRRDLILGAAARKIIVQDPACALGVQSSVTATAGARSGAGRGDARMICTVSMP